MHILKLILSFHGVSEYAKLVEITPMIIYGLLMIYISAPLVENTPLVIYGLLQGEGYAKLVENTPLVLYGL